MPFKAHEEFLELCALSTTGELTLEESARLDGHLSQCKQCRDALREFEQVLASTIPQLAVEAGLDDVTKSPDTWSIEQAEAELMEALEREPSPAEVKSTSTLKSTNPKQPRLLAIAALIVATCSTVGYQIGARGGPKPQVANIQAASPSPVPGGAARVAPPAVAPLSVSKRSLPADDEELSRLRTQTLMNQSELAKVRNQKSHLEEELASTSELLKRALEDRSDLQQQLTQAQSTAQGLQSKLNQTAVRTVADTDQALAANTQVEALKSALAEKDRQIALDRDLLEHDQDIRNLMGARDLYIAEIYDVAKTGDTQKPFGRIFYTKDKSLIFYGYDLNQQKGVEQTSAFQAWGRRGADRQHDISLGLLYQDDANQKRWVLKFKDPKTIAQIDAVFITVEPHGGSTKPSGKPLLFAYLRLDPNHP